MTRPYTRACRQTNFSEGGFVNKDPFLFFVFYFFFFLLSLLFLTFFFCPFVIFQVSPWSVGGIHLIAQGKWVVEFGLIICQNDSRALNKVSTIAVKKYYVRYCSLCILKWRMKVYTDPMFKQCPVIEAHVLMTRSRCPLA